MLLSRCKFKLGSEKGELSETGSFLSLPAFFIPFLPSSAAVSSADPCQPRIAFTSCVVGRGEKLDGSQSLLSLPVVLFWSRQAQA